jgi:hypothetical protein
MTLHGICTSPFFCIVSEVACGGSLYEGLKHMRDHDLRDAHIITTWGLQIAQGESNI